MVVRVDAVFSHGQLMRMVKPDMVMVLLDLDFNGMASLPRILSRRFGFLKWIKSTMDLLVAVPSDKTATVTSRSVVLFICPRKPNSLKLILLQ
jgi:hypothetical protein